MGANPEKQQSPTTSLQDLVSATSGPTALRIMLGSQLRRLRLALDISREDAGYAIRASHAKISRMELGQVKFKERDVTDLLALYGVDDATQHVAVLDLVRRANEPGWWHKFGDLLPAWFEVYMGLEEAATIIRTYEIQFVPGLLQSPDYARAVVLLAHRHAPAEDVDRRVALRMRRQQRLIAPGAPTLWAVIDEAALTRPLGGEAVMRGQIDHLLEMTALPNVTLQIVPFEHGGHAAAGGPFTILRFAERDLPDLVYMEQLNSALYLDKREETDPYMEIMDLLSLQASSAPATRRHLETLREKLTG